MSLSPLAAEFQPMIVVVPLWARRGIAAGKYFLDGSILKEVANNRIAKHLDTVPLASVPGVVALAGQIARNPRAQLVGGVAAVGLVIVGAVKVPSYLERQKATEEFFDALNAYKTKAAQGVVNVNDADRLIAVLDLLPMLSTGRRAVALDLTSPQGKAFVAFVRDSLDEIAERTGRDVPDVGEGRSDDNVVDLRRYLEVQRDLLRSDETA